MLLLIASVVSDSVRPYRWQPTRLPRPWDSPGKNTGVGCHFLLQCMKVKMKLLSLTRLLAIPSAGAYQAPPSMGFSRQEYWSGVPLSSPRDTISFVKISPLKTTIFFFGFPSGKESTWQSRRCRRCRFNPWVGEIS